MLCLLCLIPASLIVPGMTDIGRPASLVSLLLCVWWIAGRIHPGLAMRGPQPLRWAIGLYLVSALVSYGMGYLRGLTLIEANAADMEILKTLAMVGVILMTADGITTRARLDRALQVLVWLCGYMGLIGIIQFMSGYDVTQNIVIPGLEYKHNLTGFEARGEGGLFRVASTATHYIEFSAAMAMVLPYALHYTRFGETRFRRQLAAVCGCLAATAIPFTLSRTGFLAAAIAILAIIPALPWRIRANVLVVLVFGTAAFVVVRPGLLGTIRSLFLGASDTPASRAARTTTPRLALFFSERPWFGRGTGTFVPSAYRILDNQWLGTLITNGLLGMAGAVHPARHRHHPGGHRAAPGDRGRRPAAVRRPHLHPAGRDGLRADVRRARLHHVRDDLVPAHRGGRRHVAAHPPQPEDQHGDAERESHRRVPDHHPARHRCPAIGPAPANGEPALTSGATDR